MIMVLTFSSGLGWGDHPIEDDSKNVQHVHKDADFSSVSRFFPVRINDTQGLRRYRVESVQGQVLALDSWSTSWKILKIGMVLQENVLLQNLLPAEIVLRDTDKKQSKSDESQIKLSFPKPTMIRLTKPVGRSLIIRSETLSTEQLDFPLDERAAADLSSFKHLSSAWFRTQKITSVLSEKSKKFKEMVQAKPGNKMPTVTKELGSIVIKHPKDGAIFFADNYPLRIAVNWEASGPINPQMGIEVYLWQFETEIGDPIKKAHESSTMIEIPRPGSYYLGVITEDRLFMSEQIIVNFE